MYDIKKHTYKGGPRIVKWGKVTIRGFYKDPVIPGDIIELEDFIFDGACFSAGTAVITDDAEEVILRKVRNVIDNKLKRIKARKGIK